MSLSKRSIFICLLILFVFINLFRWWHGGTASFWSLISALIILLFCIRVTLQWLQKNRLISNAFQLNLWLAIVALSLSFLVAEISFRCFYDRLKTYGEKNGHRFYTSPFATSIRHCDSCKAGDLYIHRPNTTSLAKTTEYAYTVKFNSLGLRESEISTQKDSSEYRILGLGDSFVEGVGTDSDSTWLKQLQRMLNNNSAHNKYTTINGGVSGGDLFFSYKLLSRCLLKYKPDLVILNLNSTDVGDVVLRGGDERLGQYDKYRLKKGPWWDFFYGSSFIVRAIALNVFHYSWTLMSPQEESIARIKAISEISKKINDYQVLSQKEHFAFLLVLQPLREDLKDTSFASAINIDSTIQKINLTPFFIDRVKKEGNNLNRFYWPIDGHFTPYGYGFEAEIIYDNYFLNK